MIVDITDIYNGSCITFNKELMIYTNDAILSFNEAVNNYVNNLSLWPSFINTPLH